MIERKTARNWSRLSCSLLFWSIYVSTIFYGTALVLHKVTSGHFWNIDAVKACCEFIIQWGWIPTVSWVFLKPIHYKIEKRLCPPTQELIIHKLVSEMFERLKPVGGDDSNFRVTLFKRRSFSILALLWRINPQKRLMNPWGSWLIPYERSGFQRRVSKRHWKIDINSPSKNEGVVGACYGQDAVVFLESLPSNSEFLSTGGKKRKKEYARKTYIEISEIEERLLNDQHYIWPKSFWGVKVLVGGKPWGVLLIDSTLEKIGGELEIHTSVKEFLKMLDIVLSTIEED